MQQEIEAFNAHAITAATFVRSSKAGTIFGGETTAELIASAKGWLQKGSPMRQLRGVDTFLIELCASADSDLIKNVPCGSVAIRITDMEDLTKRGTVKVVEEIVRVSKKNDVQVIVWVATLCTSGVSLETRQRCQRCCYLLSGALRPIH